MQSGLHSKGPQKEKLQNSTACKRIKKKLWVLFYVQLLNILSHVDSL